MFETINDKALVFGRFQPFHNGHLLYVQTVADKYKSFLVGITNPSPNMVEPDKADDHRHLPSSNPFTYYERMKMIQSSLIGVGYSASSFDIVPFPINKPELFQYYIPKSVDIFVSICRSEPWGEEKIRILTNLKFKVYKLSFERKISGTQIRHLMKNGGNWESLVPKEVVSFIKKNGLAKKIANLNMINDDLG